MQLENNVDDIYTQETEAKNNDIGMINPHSGAGVLVRENGLLEAFADYGLGFRIDPETQSFSIFAPNLKLFYQKIEEIRYDQNMTFIKDEYKEALDAIDNKESD